MRMQSGKTHTVLHGLCTAGILSCCSVSVSGELSPSLDGLVGWLALGLAGGTRNRCTTIAHCDRWVRDFCGFCGASQYDEWLRVKRIP